MKKNILYLLLLTLFGGILILAGCTSNKKVISTQAFQKAYKESKIMHSMKSYTLQKPKDGYICILKREMSLYDQTKWEKLKICSAIESLDEQIRKELELL